MSLWKLITRSLKYYWRTNVAVAAGVAVAVAVLVGSLVVGGSVRGSLRRLALERLGDVDYVLQRDRFFRASLAAEINKALSVQRPAVPLCRGAIILEGSAKSPETGVVVPKVTVIAREQGLSREAAEYMFADERQVLESFVWGREAHVNAWLAKDLGVGNGDAILISVGRKASAPMETVFGRKKREDTVVTRRVVVKKVIPAEGGGRFTLRADRPRPRNIYVSLDWLQNQLDEPDRVNTLLVSAAPDAPPDLGEKLQRALAGAMMLADYDLLLEQPAPDFLMLKSTRLLVPHHVDFAVQQIAQGRNWTWSWCLVYLANEMSVKGGGGKPAVLPYSLVASVGAPASLAVQSRGEIVLNQWAADDLSARPGDEVEASFYVSGARGELKTVKHTFKVAGVVPMSGAALDDSYVPEFEGMTDSENMGDWDPPFPIDLKLIRPKDEAYWDRYRTTPKAFLSLDRVHDLWSPPGTPLWNVGPWNAMRIARSRGPLRTGDKEAFAAGLLKRLSPKDAGLVFQAVRKEALEAARTPTDFGFLFFLMSFFLVAAAAGLIWLLLRLTVDQRAGQIGILLASGFTQDFAAKILVGEAILVALGGLVVGVPLGIAYAWGIIAALTGGWSGAVAAFPLTLHVTPLAVIIGGALGLAVAAAAIVLSSRVLRRLSAVVLLGGWRAIAATAESPSARRAAKRICLAALAVAAVLLILWGAFEAVPAAAAFATSGGLLLVGLLALFSVLLQRRGRKAAGAPKLSLARLALRGASRHWVRSLLTAGLLAAATLIIVTVAAFRRDPTRLHPGPKESGSGGFHLLARSDLPIYADLNTETGRKKLGFTPEASKRMRGATVYAFRQSRGDDVSCLNLQRPKTPKILGVPKEMIERGGFRFSARIEHIIRTEEETGNPWKLLEADNRDGAIPAFADADTAQWQLKVGLNDYLKVPTPGAWGEVPLRIVGLMPGSVFAGELLISEEDFTRLFGGESGYRFFLVECAPGTEAEVTSVLRETLGELGLDVQRTTDVLAAYASVQNTYLSAFETLGGLGLLLATFGIVTVLLRSVIERRAELAMMLAVGFRKAAVTSVVLLENAMLLVVGVAIGTASALVAAGPQLASTVADVNWLSLAGTLGLAIAVGLVSCAAAARASLGGELVPALRSE